MKLVIQQKRIISSLQQDFSILFPFLKIEFFSLSEKNSVNGHRRHPLHGSKSLEECRSVFCDDDLVIYQRMSVSELEKKYKQIFGLSVKVYRLSGKAWLETSITDEWSLKDQNEYGKELSSTKRLAVA